MGPDSIWEIVFLMVILKIPIAYLCAVVWWAIRAEPFPDEGTAGAGDDEPLDPRPPWWRPPHRRRSPGPHGMPAAQRAHARPHHVRAR